MNSGVNRVHRIRRWSDAVSPPGSVQTKICGLTRVEDAQASVELGARYLGLNFWSGSSRYLSIPMARAIRAITPTDVALVGVFVNENPAKLEAVVEHVGLDLVQLHGDEEPSQLESISVPVIRAFRVGPQFRESELDAWAGAWGFLFDAFHETEVGGTGQAWSWRNPGSGRPQTQFLAGGLRPDNVVRALGQVRPQVVDVCSGVESAPGIKDHRLLKLFFSEVSHG